MEDFLFADGEDICLYKDGQLTKRHSKYIEKYKAVSERADLNSEWKYQGLGAQFRGDIKEDVPIKTAVTGVWFTPDESEVAYSCVINNSSGIYKINLADEKVDEAHITNSANSLYYGGCLDTTGNLLATEERRGYYNSDITVFDLTSGNSKTLTEGDTVDEDPFISPDNANEIYFATRGVGRNGNGEFVCFSPSSICKLDISRLQIEEVLKSDKFSYYKPVLHQGKLYAIRTPVKEKGSNPILEIILIPFRILQAIVNFINVFVTAFTGKSLASGGNNPTKARSYDGKKEFIRGNLIDAEKELKRNARKEKGDGGFVPYSWKLIEAESGKVIKSGVADYDIAEDGTIIITNGKRIFAVKDGVCEKLLNTERCLKVSVKHKSKKKVDLFDF